MSVMCAGSVVCRNNLIHIQPELLLELHYLLEVCKTLSRL